MSKDDRDFYERLRQRMSAWAQSDEGKRNKWAEYLMLAPDLFHLLCKLALDDEVPKMSKAKIAGAIAYFVAPVDLIPEALLGPIGYVDDIAVAAFVLNQVVNDTSPEIVQRHWAGDGDVLKQTQKIVAAADEMVGSGLWSKLKNKFKG